MTAPPYTFTMQRDPPHEVDNSRSNFAELPPDPLSPHQSPLLSTAISLSRSGRGGGGGGKTKQTNSYPSHPLSSRAALLCCNTCWLHSGTPCWAECDSLRLIKFKHKEKIVAQATIAIRVACSEMNIVEGKQDEICAVSSLFSLCCIFNTVFQLK